MLPSVAAAVIGGTSIMGGRGGYSGTIVGALILTVLTSLLIAVADARSGPPDPVRRHHRGRRRRLHADRRRGVSLRVPTQHLGIDIGVTNLKWAVVETDGDDWRILDRGQVADALGRGPRRGHRAHRRRPAATAVDAMADDRHARDRRSRPVRPGDRHDPLPREHARRLEGPGGRARRSSAALGIPVALINDARAFGLAELRLGAGRGADSMVGLTLGTGVGGVIAIDGHVHLGHDGTAGEVGHQVIDPDGPSCNCGNHGCLEAFARADRIAEACGTETVEEAVEAARAGDPRALGGPGRASAATSGSGSAT